MYRFTFHQFELRGRHYVPLPKMNGPQLAALARRLQDLGFRTAGEGRVRGRKGDMTVTLDGRGLCWSNGDLTDTLAPAIPEILTMKKVRVSLGALSEKYFEARRSRRRTIVRLTPRMESSSLWSILRAAGACALTPDERRVYSRLISLSPLDAEFIADYPSAGCSVKVIGRRQYYSCCSEEKEIAADLRSIDQEHSRNTYLPRNSMLSLSALKVSREALRSIFDDLGEWCYFVV